MRNAGLFKRYSVVFLVGGLSCSSLQAQNYYLSSSQGNDINNGKSTDAPWKNLDMIYKGSFAPGDKILLKSGDVWNAQLRFNMHGTAANPITISSYGAGPKPVIYGDNATAVWTPVAGHPAVYVADSGAGTLVSMAYEGANRYTQVKEGKLNLNNAADLDTYLNQLTPGSFGPATGGWSQIWAKTLSGSAPTNVKVFRAGSVIGAGSYVIVDGPDVRNAVNGLLVQGMDHPTLRNCSVQDTIAVGIYLQTNVSNALVENNTTTRTGNDGILIWNGNNNTLRGNKISQVTDTILGIPTKGDQCGIGLGSNANNTSNNNNLIEHNILSNLKNSCFDYYFENGTTVRDNFCQQAGGAAFPHGTNLTLNNNIFLLNGTGKGSNSVNTGSGRILIYNNVFYLPALYGIMASGSNIYFRNNIVYGGTTLAKFGDGVSSDYNCYYTPGSSSFVWNKAASSSLSAFQQASGQESHSIYADPLFASSAPSLDTDFRLQPLSPCIDHGVDLQIDGVVNDYLGTAVPQGVEPDIGAFEYVPSPTTASQGDNAHGKLAIIK